MQHYPETLFEKFFSYLSVSNPSRETLFGAITDRRIFLYKYAQLPSYVIAAVTIVVLSVLYYKWRKSIHGGYFIGLLLIGGFNIWFLLISLVVFPNIVGKYLYSVSIFPAVVCLLSKYAYAHNSKEKYLIYAVIGIQSLVSAAVVFWKNNLLRVQVPSFEPMAYNMFHIITAILFYGGLGLLFYLLWNPIRAIAESNGRKYYANLCLVFTGFWVIWGSVVTYVYAHAPLDIVLVPLWARYIMIILPNLFLATFSIYFMYALYRVRN